MKKNVQKFGIAAVILFSVLTVSYGQTGKEKRADKNFDRLAYANAIEIYEGLVNQGYVNTSVLQNLGDAYYFNGKLTEAHQWYSELFEGDYKDKNSALIPSEYYYRYAQTLKSQKNYVKSKEFLDQFYKLEGGDSRAALYNKNPDYLTQIARNSDRYEIKALALNSEYSDYGATMLGDQLIFTSARATADQKGNAIHSWTNESYTSLYSAQISNEGIGEPVRLPMENTSINEATAVFTADGNTMYFTRNNAKSNGKSQQNKAHTSLLKIYKAIKQADGQWGQVEELPINSDDFSTAHPALTPDGKWLYFASDRKGSIGQSDLYRVALHQNGSYGPVENLGKTINTEGRESFPFISSDNQLYFSSDGHPGLGGLDVFVTKISSDGNFESVENMGEPINSPLDDFSFFIDTKQKKGFISSNRPGGKGADDIYAWSEKACKQIIEGTVYDKQTKVPIPNATVVLSASSSQKSDTLRTDQKGNYTIPLLICGVNYHIKVEAESFNAIEVAFNSDSEAGVKRVDIGLEKPEIPLEVNDDLFRKLNLKPIYFDLNKSDIRPDAGIELMKVVELMKKYPSLKVDVRAHTDSKGKDAYNLSLSDRRAKSTMQWMIMQGIGSDRLTGRGYGETQLLNRCSNGVRCSDAEHQENRRSEFIVVEK
ncbi:PD40 domain-containing protein [Myroides sp. NP-2]|uniref:OmpA family protein n=1 Tax=Myroides sp. NP-2 TaxID=2759945 RepID=UPI0015FC9F57|nr:OmpA family protein [Myroides sp. NP-2]MBB1151461.1 PD40 domain-containing protein [Myroides sp. NP-2]